MPAAEALWYDTSRWGSFVDGFAHVARLEGDWPAAGAQLTWDSRPHGRGRVIERVLWQKPGEGQGVEVEDERLAGRQTVRFEELEDGVGIELELDYRLKRTNPLTPLVDVLFVRRALAASLRRTLERFDRELAAEGDLFE